MATKNIPSQSLLRELLSYDPVTGHLTWRERSPEFAVDHGLDLGCVLYWNRKHAGTRAFAQLLPSGYLSGTLLASSYRAHRVIWKLAHGTDPAQIDHIDGNRTNNALSNLRSVSGFVNQKNRRMNSNNTSGVTGVNRCKMTGRWVAKIQHRGRHIMLGRFPSIEAAANARRVAERQYGFHENHGRPA